MATQVYLIMYVLMFIAAVRLRRRQPDHPRGYRAPALRLLCLVGATSSVSALVLGFIAPSQFGHSNRVLYALFILGGILVIGIVPRSSCTGSASRGWKAAGTRRPPSCDLHRDPGGSPVSCESGLRPSRNAQGSQYQPLSYSHTIVLPSPARPVTP